MAAAWLIIAPAEAAKAGVKTATRIPRAFCELPSQGLSLVGDTVRFVLSCPDTAGLRVSWEIEKEGIRTDTLPGQLTYARAFARPGRYQVFARIQGEQIPATTVQTVIHPPTAVRPAHSSTIVYDSAAQRIWCVNPDNHSVSALDAQARTLLFEAPAGKNPRTLARAAGGDIWTANQDDATLSILDGSTGALKATVKLPYASRPFGIAMAPGGQTAYVTLEATGALLKIDVPGRQVAGSLPVCPTPRGIAISQDGKRILVTRFISPKDHGQVAEVDGDNFTLRRTYTLRKDANPSGSVNGHGVPNAITSVAITPDGRQAWVPFKMDNVNRGLFVGDTDLTFESTVRTAVAILDLESGREIDSLRADFDNRSLAAAVAFDSRGLFGYVATLASNQVTIRHGDNAEEASAIDPNALESELAPEGLVLDEKDSLLFVHYFMSRQVVFYDISDVGKGNLIDRVALVRTINQERLDSQVFAGKQVFYNAADRRMSLDKYTSCVVCHMDGGSDRRVWDFTGRGEGLRKTTSLLGRGGMAHGPVHWSANFDEIQDFEHDIRGPFGGKGFMADADFNSGTRNKTLGDRKTGLSPELDAMAAYVASLQRVNPSPYRNADGSMTADAKAGLRLFQSAEVGCAKCHSGPGYTDSRLPKPGDPPPTPGPGDFVTAEGFLLHDVGTLVPGSGKRLNDTLKGIDAPTLKGIWEMAPYFHDGSAETLMDVLTTRNAGDRHGKTSHLSAREKEQLVAFLLQLDETDSNGVSGLRPPRARSFSGLRALQAGMGLRGFAWHGPGAPPDLEIIDARGKTRALFPAPAWRRTDHGYFLAWPGSQGGLGPGIYFARARRAPFPPLKFAGW